MEIIPVLDLKAGQAVHAVKGDRQRYAPVQGVLGSGEEPLALAAAYRDRLGCCACYVADLDAIAGGDGHPDLLAAIAGLGLQLWVDAGTSSVAQAQTLLDLGAGRVIIGSETLASLQQLRQMAEALPPQQLVLSVDLKGGVLRAPAAVSSPEQLVAQAAQAGVQQIILLDLARVGAAAGPPLDLLTVLHPRFENLSFYAGGGVRHRHDLAALAEAGAAGALIATAFHRGNLTAADVSRAV
jgi:phosphoribosylformimino-5-aminoimidazole carboxamide ribotide isomerase